jgi:ribonuclease HI
MTPGESIEDYRNNFHNFIENTHSDTITCYTDGSRTEAGCGSGYIIITNNNDTMLRETYFKLPDHCSVFQAELSATRDACNNLTTEESKHTIIWTDSLSAIQALTTCTIRSRTVLDCNTAIGHIANNYKVEIRWIAAHKGLWGNEIADEIAKLGSLGRQVRTSEVPPSPNPTSRIKSITS